MSEVKWHGQSILPIKAYAHVNAINRLLSLLSINICGQQHYLVKKIIITDICTCISLSILTEIKLNVTTKVQKIELWEKSTYYV